MIIGSEPVSIDAISDLQQGVRAVRVAEHGVQTVLRHRRGDAVRRDHRPRRRGDGRVFRPRAAGRWQAVRVARDAPNAVAQVSCGQVARSQWAVIVDPDTGCRIAGRRGRRNLVAGQQRRPRLLGPARRNAADVRRRAAIAARRRQPRGGRAGRAHLVAHRRPGRVSRRRAVCHRPDRGPGDIDGRNHYPQDIEATVAEASPMVRRGYVTAFSVPDGDARMPPRLVVVAERAAGTSRARSAAGDRGDPRSGLAAAWFDSLRRAFPAGRRHPADHQRQAGPPGLPGGIPRRHPGRPLIGEPNAQKTLRAYRAG